MTESVRRGFRAVVPARLWARLRLITRVVRPLREHPMKGLLNFRRFVADLRRFRAERGEAATEDLLPMLFDRGVHPVDYHYVVQGHWAMSGVLGKGPIDHVDVGGQTAFVAMLAAACPVTMVDIRPVPIELPGMSCTAASILELPFADRSLMSVSCLHVLEHVGLGRYGDPIDPRGTARGAAELERVLASGGTLYVSLPVGRQRVEFNAHRVHTPLQVVAMFPGLQLCGFSAVTDEGVPEWNVDVRDPQWEELDYGCGLFEFTRRDFD